MWKVKSLCKKNVAHASEKEKENESAGLSAQKNVAHASEKEKENESAGLSALFLACIETEDTHLQEEQVQK